MEAVRPKKSKSKSSGKSQVTRRITTITMRCSAITLNSSNVTVDWCVMRCSSHVTTRPNANEPCQNRFLTDCLTVVLCSLSLSQLSRKQRQAEEAPAAPPAVEEALYSEFSDIPLSLPYQGQDPAPSLAATTDVTKDQPSEIPLSSSTTLASDPQTLTLSADTTLATAETESQIAPKTQQSDDERLLVETRGQDLRAETESTKAAETGHQRWIESCLAAKVDESPAVPSAPALYPSLTGLGEAPLMLLSEEALGSCKTRGPAVLALAEQEMSPPSLQPLGNVAALPRSRLYPELPKTAPEVEVNQRLLCTTTKALQIITSQEYIFTSEYYCRG